MKAIELKIHNFRSICDTSISLGDCGLLVGTNNAGKSTVIDAIRMFYGKDVKFNERTDFPHKGAMDKESWIEIEFKPTPEEYANLKDDYKTDRDTFRVRNYLRSEHKAKDGKLKSGPYAYIDGSLSEERFYGFKNVGQGKFGEIIYIPAVSKIHEHTKLTGPSALRDLLSTVLSKVMEQSGAYLDLHHSFQNFEGAIKTETTEDGYSIQSIEQDISRELEEWGASFRLNVNAIGVDDLIKGLIGHEIIDSSLEAPQPVHSYGQGFQRSVIYTLIRVAAKYSTSKGAPKKKEFSPELTWILFEEPEAFLHPTQISALSSDLRKLASGDSSQVLLSTHSPQFATHSIQELPSICRLQRDGGISKAFQISATDLEAILASNQQDTNKWKAAGIKVDQDDLQEDMEGLKYALWLDSKRCGAFFAERVLLVEGPTETALLAYMYDQGLVPECRGVFIVDTIGKYNMHRFMRIFELLGIKHYVLYDGDNNKLAPVDDSINAARNKFTGGIDTFPDDLESFLGIPPVKGRNHRKPQHVMFHVVINNVQLDALTKKISALLSN